jgi:two-component system, OmpR family, response regulator RpaB
MPRDHIVVVEDEPAIRRGIVDALRLTGYTVTESGDGNSGLVAASSAGIDLVLLDLMLPRRDGLEVLAELRKTHPSRPVIILTARGTEEDRVRGLKMGADDYVVKPFSARELLARVEAVLRRTRPRTPEVRRLDLKCGNIDLARREVCWNDGDRQELSETETGILEYLLRNRERAVSREELLTHVWHIEAAGLETRTVDMHIARLRAKLRHPNGIDTPEVIVTVRSHGYMAGTNLSIVTEG